jgi:nanoRNase/pAp phosphatase (c-di-AMP/oligoRNAs hydrolase)
LSNKAIDFTEVLGDETKEIPIIIHNMPDPDAISSGMGIRAILNRLGYKPGPIIYSGEVSHPQNLSMTTLLNIDALVNVSDYKFEPGAKAILVDTNDIGPDSNQRDINSSDVDIVIVIDHHKGKHPKEAKVDTRYVGACASIVWDYLNTLKYDFKTDEGKMISTALITGISTDTDTLMSSNVSDLDYKAFQALKPHVDEQKLNGIMRYPLPPYLFELRQKAFQEDNKSLQESTMVSGIGIIAQAKRDALPIISDEFLRMTGVTTAVVFAIVKDDKAINREEKEYIDVCVRSKNQTIDVGNFLQKIFYAGGGKPGAGRAKIPLGFFATNGDAGVNQEIWHLVNKLVHKKVFTNVKGE